MTAAKPLQTILDNVPLKQMYHLLPEFLQTRLNNFLATLKPSTANVYKGTLIHFLYRINNNNPLQLRQYNTQSWNDYANAYLQGYDAATHNNKVNHIKSFFNFLITTGERKSDPLDGYELMKVEKKENSKRILSWEEINKLKQITDENLKEIFDAAYYNNSPLSVFSVNGSTIAYRVRQMGSEIGIDNLKYSDITESRKLYFAICPVTGRELEMTEENWTFQDGLLQSRWDYRK